MNLMRVLAGPIIDAWSNRPWACDDPRDPWFWIDGMILWLICCLAAIGAVALFVLLVTWMLGIE